MQPAPPAQVSSPDSLRGEEPVLDGRVRQVPAELARAVREDPDANLPRLVAFLVQGRQGDSARARVIHDWLADNIVYDVQGYASGRLPSGSPADALRTGRSVCQGFGNLFEEMCKLAGIECITVSGYGRGYSFRLFDEEDLTKSNHAWNAVRIDGRWRLVDVTWDAGYVREGRYVKEYNLNYFFLDPGAFIFTHFPTDARWQLLSPPLSAQQFTSLPPLHGGFWAYGLRFTTEFARVNCCEDRLEFSIVAPPNVSVMAQLQRANETKVQGAVAVRRDGDVHHVSVTFPSPGRWLLRLYARAGSPYGYYDWIADLGFASGAAVP